MDLAFWLAVSALGGFLLMVLFEGLFWAVAQMSSLITSPGRRRAAKFLGLTLAIFLGLLLCDLFAIISLR